MLTDPYLIFARCFSSWFRIKILIGFIFCWLIVQLALSIWTTFSFRGDIDQAHLLHNFHDVENSICTMSPYSYLTPFSFKIVSSLDESNIKGYNELTVCPWPELNTTIRLIDICFAIVALIVLLFKTPFSLLARPIYLVLAIFSFICFVIDTTSFVNGELFCKDNFSNTSLGNDLLELNYETECDVMRFQVIGVFNLIIAFLFLVLHTAWGLTSDLYINPNANNNEVKRSMQGTKQVKKPAGKKIQKPNRNNYTKV